MDETAAVRRGSRAWQFFALTFGLSWGAWLPSWLLMHGIVDPGPAINVVTESGKWIGGAGPSIAGFALAARNRGRTGIRELASKALEWRIGVWYLPALLMLPGAVVLAHLINGALGGVLPKKEILSTPWMIVPLFLVFLVLQMGEEFGWRGYALESLQRGSSALAASLVVGCAWAVWHEHGIPWGHFAVTLIAVSVFITWMQNGAGGSLVPAFICHALISLTGEVLPLWSDDGGTVDATAWIIANGLLIVFALIVIRVAGAQTLVRHRT